VSVTPKARRHPASGPSFCHRTDHGKLAALDIEPELRAELAALRETLRGAEARVREILG
jgi:hypothetical protein